MGSGQPPALVTGRPDPTYHEMLRYAAEGSRGPPLGGRPIIFEWRSVDSVAPPIEIDDYEFELLLEKIIDMWALGFDTASMAALLMTTEAKTAYVLSCLIEGKYLGKEEDNAASAVSRDRA